MNPKHKQILETIASDMGISLEIVKGGRRHQHTAITRSMMAYTAMILLGLSGNEAAELIGYGSRRSVYSARDRVRGRVYDKKVPGGDAIAYTRKVVDRVMEDAA